MKKVSYWAKGHIRLTRIIIVASYILLCFTGIFTGKLISGLDVILPQFVLNIFLMISGLLFVFYPEKKKDNYLNRKSFDFALVFATFFMMIIAGNNKNIVTASENIFASAIVTPGDSSNSLNNNHYIISFIDQLHHTDISKLSVHEKKQILKQQIREIRKDKQLTRGEKLLLILLSMTVALILMMGIVGLACNLACAGSGTAATILWLGGWFFIIFFLARTINYISRGPRQRARQKRQDALKKTNETQVNLK